MSRAEAWLSDAAVVDIVEQADWYEHHSGADLARRWEREVELALIRIEKNPRSGAKCSFRPAELHDIRWMPIDGFSRHLIFYRLEQDEIQILRILHGARDLAKLF